MSIADRRHRSIRRAFVITALLVGVGIIGYRAMRSGHDAPEVATQAVAEPAPTSVAPVPSVATSASTSVASGAAIATPASSHAASAMPPWHASLQPAVVAATRIDALATYQVQMERWTCEGDQCIGNFRIPPTVAASRNMSSAAQVFDNLKQQMARQDVDVTLNSINPGPQGLAMSFQFMPNKAVPGRYYTDREIGAIRAESFEQGHKAAEQELSPRGRDSAH